MTSVSASHIILTLTQPVGSGRLQRESNPGPPHQESRALSTELPRALYGLELVIALPGYTQYIYDPETSAPKKEADSKNKKANKMSVCLKMILMRLLNAIGFWFSLKKSSIVWPRA